MSKNNLNSQIDLVKQSIQSLLKSNEIYFNSEKYRFRSRNEYFDSISHIWEIASKEPECIEYNRGLFLLHNFTINENIDLSLLKNLFVKYYGDSHRNQTYNSDEYCFNETLGEHHNKEKLIQDIEDLIKNKSHLLDYEDLELIFSNYCEYSDNILESLSYWTIYFEPRVFDEEVAYKCNLIPFKYVGEYEERELLALGGCGMDLSPKLDAYQAMIHYPEKERF